MTLLILFPRLVRALSLVLVRKQVLDFNGISNSRRKFASSRWKPRDTDPLFSSVWRQFQKKVHPDLLNEVPELRDKNAKALQELQGVLNDVKTSSTGIDGTSGTAKERSSLLTARTISLEFFVRTEKPVQQGEQQEGPSSSDNTSSSPRLHFLRVPFSVRIPGPNCQRVLAESLSVLFGHCGLSTRFRWGNEYFGSVWVENKVVNSEND